MQAYYHKVQYYETDAMGIVHHSNYLRFLEEARNEFTNQSELPYVEVEKAGYLCPVAASHCKYHVAARFGETLRIITKCESYNGVRLVYSYRVENVTTGALCLTG
ncbi:MAG: acyl-CoA thioesterase, partial [Firmicutes bacterium]|nr:acyl-CoA thioesterase [Bacillota bacterium]